jgi:hypothetical protein
MRKRLSRVLLVVGICLSLTALPALAQGKSGDKGKGGKSVAVKTENGKGKSEKAEIKIKDDKDKDKGKKDHSKSHIGWNPKGPDDRPPGWDQGQKRGWGDCDVPPGLAKKRGCDHTGYSKRERDVVAKVRERGGAVVVVGGDKNDGKKKEESIFTKASREAERRKAEEQAKKKPQ